MALAQRSERDERKKGRSVVDLCVEKGLAVEREKGRREGRGGASPS